MERSEFLSKLAQMTPEEINELIRDKGKKKEPEYIEIPFSIVD